jgi:hypothetical protein
MRAFLAELLWELDRTAELVECDADPTRPGYRVQLRVAGGELTKARHFPTTLLTRAQQGDAFAVHAVRAVLRTWLLGIVARQVRDRSLTTRHEWRRGSSPEIVAVAALEGLGSAQLRGRMGQVTSYGRRSRVTACPARHSLEVGNVLRVLHRDNRGLGAARACGCTWAFSQPYPAPS